MNTGRYTNQVECIKGLKSDLVQQHALGRAMEANATDVVIRCQKYWENPNCPMFLDGCIGVADLGRAIHLHLIHPDGKIPEYHRISSSAYQVLQTMAFSDENKDGQVEPFFVVQKAFDRATFSRVFGSSISCGEMLEHPKFESIISKIYFKKNGVTESFVFNCFNINKNGFASLIKSKPVNRNSH